MPKATESKAIRTMIENAHPAYWIYYRDSRGFQLIAQTAIYENGTIRTKQVWRTNILADAVKMHCFLVKNHKRYYENSFQEAMEEHYYQTGKKLDGLFTRECKNNIPEVE